MQRPFVLAATLAASFLATDRAAAQRTWIVDARGGPGVHFTDLLTAVPAAAPGDTIRVVGPRRTDWACPTIDKGVALVTDPTAGMRLDALEIENLPGRQRFSARGFVCFYMSVRNCAGGVFLGECSVTSNARTLEIAVRDASLVSLKSGHFTRLRAARSRVIASDATGTDWHFHHCVTEISGGYFWGASYPWSGTPTSAATVRFGTFRATAEAAFVGGAGRFSQLPGIDAAGGTVEIDPSVILNGHTPARVPVPSMDGAIVSATRTGSLSVFGTAGEQYVVVAGLPAPLPVTVPGIGTITVDLATLFPIVVGTIRAAGRFDFPLPSAGVPEGTAIALQAVRLSPTPHIPSIPIFPVVGN